MNTGKAVKEPISEQPQPGDYYGVVYKGSFILPILGMLLAIGLWWVLKRRRRE